MVAVAIDEFRAGHSYDDVAVITYSVQGTESIPDGFSRLEYFGLSAVPDVMGDGSALLEGAVDTAQLESLYGSLSGSPAGAEMSVTRDSDSQFTISITAETAINANLVALSYESIQHEGKPYPCLAREFLTDYWGENVTLAAGASTTIVKTVSNTAVAGVVAWLEDNNRFTSHEVIQAADSQGSSTPNTPTPTPTSDPGTPTPTPTQNPNSFYQEFDLSLEVFHPGDLFELYVHTVNGSASAVDINQYIALQVLDSFYFWKNWSTTEVESYPYSFPAGYDDMEEILVFQWPNGAGSFSPLYFWVAGLDQGNFDVLSLNSVEFGYTQ